MTRDSLKSFYMSVIRIVLLAWMWHLIRPLPWKARLGVVGILVALLVSTALEPLGEGKDANG